MLAVLLAVLQIFFGVAILLLLIAIAAYPLSFPWVAYHLAKWRILLCPVDENTGRWIVRGGKAWRFITPSWELDPRPATQGDVHSKWPLPEKKWEDHKLENAEGEELGLIAWIDRRLPGGIRWVGPRFLGYRIHEYNFRWNVIRESMPLDTEDGFVEKRRLDSGKWVVSFAKRLDYIYLRDAVYEFELNGAETQELMPVDIVMLATIRVVDPYLTLFIVHDWLEANFDLTRPIIRSWVKKNCYDAVVGKREVAEREFDDLVHDYTGFTREELNKLPPEQPKPKTIATYVEDSYGIRIKRIGFDQVTPPDEYITASTNRVVAKQNKFTAITNAEAQKKSQKLIGEGEAARLDAVLKKTANNPDALELRKIEALENVGANGNMVVLSGESSQLLLSPPQKRLETPTTKAR